MDDWEFESEIASLKSELAELAKAPTYPEWERLHIAYSAYILNFNQLAQHLVLPNEDVELGQDLLNPDPTLETKRNYELELFRFLLNYCATVSTLVDHSRTFMKRYRTIESEMYREYQERLNRIANLEVAIFVQNLRNYMLHYRLPSTTHQMSFTTQPSTISFQILLDCAKLREWDNWKPLAKQYLRDRDQVALIEAVEQYTHSVEELYTWLFGQAIDTTMQTAQRRMAVQTKIVTMKERLDKK